MANTASVGSRMLRAALLGPLLGMTALSTLGLSLGAGTAEAKVGVTSATDGDPLGKPPMANERVLRIGIDVRLGELGVGRHGARGGLGLGQHVEHHDGLVRRGQDLAVAHALEGPFEFFIWHSSTSTN